MLQWLAIGRIPLAAFGLPIILLAACLPVPASPSPVYSPSPLGIPSSMPFPSATSLPPSLAPSPTPMSLVPNFMHIVIIVLENREFGLAIGSPKMPNFNRWAQEYTLLTQHYAITHPSLPNYLAMIGGDTFGVTRNCRDCFIDAPSLPDLIEASGRTWKTYQEDLPRPCYLGDTSTYVQKHNPFIYFDPIRLDAARCERSIVPLTEIDADLAGSALPNFVFITPNLCNSAHDCGLDVADAWLGTWVGKLMAALEGRDYLIILTWDEGQGSHSCCGLPEEAGGRVATVLVSPLVKRGFQDDTPYTHYSLLKTIAEAWGLPYLGHAADESNALILAPWK